MPVFPPLVKRSDQIQHFDPGLKDFHVGGLFYESWRSPMDRVILPGCDRSQVVYRTPQDVEHPPQRLRSDRDADRRAGRIGGFAALQSIR